MLKILLVLTALTLNYIGYAQADRLMASPASLPGYTQLIDEAETLMESHPNESIILVINALKKIDERKDPLTASRAYVIIGDACYYNNDIDSAIVYYHEAARVNIRYGNIKTYAHINILGNLGYLYGKKDQHLIALDYSEQALALAREIGDKSEIAANLANIGQIKTLLGDYEEALIYMEEALAIDRETGNEPDIATDLNTIGRLYESWGLYDKAISYLEQALEIDTRLENREKMAIRYNSLGLAYKGWGKLDRALEYFNKALEIDSQTVNLQKVALRMANIGAVYIEMNQADTAIRYLKEGLGFFLENDMPSYSAQALNEMGRSYMLQKDYEKAELSFLESMNISQNYGLNRFRLQSLDFLAKAYKESGQYSQSLTTLYDYVMLKDSIFGAETQKRMAEFHAKYELDKRQRENELLRKDQEISRTRQTIMALIFSLSALALVILILSLLARMRGVKNRRLIAERENERLKTELEQRSKELTYNAMCIIKNNETVAKIAETIEEAISSGEDKSSLNRMVRQLQNMEREKNWNEFEVRFTQVHEDFYEKLNTRFPGLSPNEKKLCAFLRLNMSSKDIAAITHQSVHSINVARTRMRKKLNLDGTEENLVRFLHAL